MRPLTNKGLTLLGVVIAFTLVAGAATLVMKIFQSQNSLFSFFDRKGKAQQVLASTAASMALGDFDSLWDYCKRKNVATTPKSAFNCVSNNTLNPAADGSNDSDDRLYQLEMLRDWKGDPTTQSLLCLELSSCTKQGEGRLLEMNLNIYWKGNGETLMTQNLSFRKTRW